MARPREFDEDQVLDAAMRTFWLRGYEGATLSELVEATGLGKPSLYKAFGNKEGLFRRVVERYDRDHLCFRHEALAEPTPRRIVERLLKGTIELHASRRNPPGCLETNAALACSVDAEDIRLELAAYRDAFTRRLRQRFDEVRSAGSLPQGMNSEAAASLVSTLIQGMAVQAKSGARPQDLRRIVSAALLGWPADSIEQGAGTDSSSSDESTGICQNRHIATLTSFPRGPRPTSPPGRVADFPTGDRGRPLSLRVRGE
jgi:AcrR family transcriptional regulator